MHTCSLTVEHECTHADRQLSCIHESNDIIYFGLRYTVYKFSMCTLCIRVYLMNIVASLLFQTRQPQAAPFLIVLYTTIIVVRKGFHQYSGTHLPPPLHRPCRVVNLRGRRAPTPLMAQQPGSRALPVSAAVHSLSPSLFPFLLHLNISFSSSGYGGRSQLLR